ncbi:MAG: polyprenyl synthetase family protein [Planctomycetota bacterium]|nr:MAG: polyprenyl synthetase family protein [Planctomycetota bacterium]
MRYAALGGGKRVRPALAMLWSEAVCGALEPALPFAVAIECVHVYSLVHDDLPAMDDDPLRRGKPSCHVAFGEALAILAGDALLTFAFEHIATRYPRPETAAALVRTLARAAGPAGMVGGQVLDLRGEGRTARAPERTEAALEAIHRAKTGALITAACVGGVIAAGGDGALQGAARRYGEALGLLFQVTDDIIDCTSSTEELGKTAGKDAGSGKLTYPALLGIEGARERAHALAREATGALEPLEPGPAREQLAAMVARIRDRSR